MQLARNRNQMANLSKGVMGGGLYRQRRPEIKYRKEEGETSGRTGKGRLNGAQHGAAAGNWEVWSSHRGMTEGRNDSFMPRQGLRSARQGWGMDLAKFLVHCAKPWFLRSGKEVRLLGLIRENWATVDGSGAVPGREKRRELLMVQRQPVARRSGARVPKGCTGQKRARGWGCELGSGLKSGLGHGALLGLGWGAGDCHHGVEEPRVGTAGGAGAEGGQPGGRPG